MKWIGFCPLGPIPALTLKRHIFCTTGAIFYFMPEGRFYAKQFFVMGRLCPRKGGGKVMGQTASLLAKTAPLLHHQSSMGAEGCPGPFS